MQSESTYNGWSNYPTWNVALWIDNDQGLQEYVLEMASGSGDTYELAERIEEFIREHMLPDLGAGMAADILGWAVDHVDWRELAAGYFTQAREA